MQSGENLTRLRKLRGLSQREVAEELNVTRQSISQWEAGRVFPSIQNQIALSRLYGVPLDELYPEETTKKEEEMESTGESKVEEVMEQGAGLESSNIPLVIKKRGKLVRKKRWIPAAILGLYIGIYLWGILTHSRGSATGVLVLLTAFLLLGILLYIAYLVILFLKKGKNNED